MSFENVKAPLGGGGPGVHHPSPVTISQVVTAGDLVHRSRALEGALQRAEFTSFIDEKVATSARGGLTAADADVWKFLKVA